MSRVPGKVYTSRPGRSYLPRVDIDKANPKDRLGALKVQLGLLPQVPQIWTALVFELGAYKYGEYNWRDCAVRITVYTGAIKRHNMALEAGEDIDPESGLPHAAHIAACAFLIEDARAGGGLIDDRFLKDKAPELLAMLTSETYDAAVLANTRSPCKRRNEVQPIEAPESFFQRVVDGLKERRAKRAAKK